jgi:hypothetical protein
LLPVPEVPPIPPGVLANRVGVSSLGTLRRQERPEVPGVRLQRRGSDASVWWGAGDEARPAAEATNDYAELVDRALVDLFGEEDGWLGRLFGWGYNSHWPETREAERGAREGSSPGVLHGNCADP